MTVLWLYARHARKKCSSRLLNSGALNADELRHRRTRTITDKDSEMEWASMPNFQSDACIGLRRNHTPPRQLNRSRCITWIRLMRRFQTFTWYTLPGCPHRVRRHQGAKYILWFGIYVSSVFLFYYKIRSMIDTQHQQQFQCRLFYLKPAIIQVQK